MPALAAIPWLGTAIAGAAGAGATIAAGKMSSNAYNKSAQLQTSAANHAADVQGQSNAEALAFQKAEAARTHQETERATHANYDQWAAQQRRYGSLDSLVGNSPREIPAYVPLSPDGSSGAPAGSLASVAGGTGLPSIDPRSGNLGAQISGYFKSRGVSDQETPYWVSKWPELLARGQEIGDPQYALKRLAAADVFGGQGMAAPTAQRATQGSLAALGNPYAPPPQTRILTPALQGSLAQIGRA